VIIVGVAVLTIGFFGTHSIASAWVGARAQISKAQASSLYLFAYYLGSSVVGSLGGVFWHLYGWHGVTAMTSALLILGVAIALWLYSTPSTVAAKANGKTGH
jgi:MFS transporter, YNFM family, putative membrane transport protein